MRKIGIQILSVLVILSMFIMMAGCTKSDSELILGKWEAKVDFTDMLNEYLDSDMAGISEYFTIKDFVLTVYFTFNEDNTYTIEIDKDASSESIKKMADTMKEGFVKYMEDLVEALSPGTSLDEYLEESGLTMDALLDEAFTAADFDELYDSFATEGNWKIDGNKLYRTEDKDDDFDESEYDTFELSGNKLTLLETFGDVADDFKLIYPVVMTRVD